MIAKRRRYSAEELARRGDALYARDVHPTLRDEDRGKIVAIDIESEDWELDADEIAACRRLEARRPDAQVWMMRVGSRYVRRFGAGRRGEAR